MSKIVSLAAFLPFVLLFSCNKSNSLLELTNEGIPKIKETLILLQGIKTVEDAKAAKPKIIGLTKYFEDLTNRTAKLKGVKQEITDELKNAMKEMKNEFFKIEVEYNRLILEQDTFLNVIGKEVEKLYLAIKK